MYQVGDFIKFKGYRYILVEYIENDNSSQIFKAYNCDKKTLDEISLGKFDDIKELRGDKYI